MWCLLNSCKEWLILLYSRDPLLGWPCTKYHQSWTILTGEESMIDNYTDTKGFKASLVAHMVKNLPIMQDAWVQSLGQEDPLEKEMATHSSILAWRIPRTEEPEGLQSMGSQNVRYDWLTQRTIWFSKMLITRILTSYFLMWMITRT